MFRIYGKGDTVSSSEYWDGRTKYNLLQKFIQGQYSTFKDLIDPIKELITQNFETFDFLERFSETEVTKTGVFVNSLQNECIITTDDVVNVTLNGSTKTYARLAPGIISYNSNININTPAVDLASKQLEDFFNLDAQDDEKVDIKYSYKTDSFKCRIHKKPDEESPVKIYEYTNGASWDDADSIGYTHSAQMLADIYNDDTWMNFFIANIGDDLTKVNIENLIQLETDGVWYWTMNLDGFVELTQDTTNKFIISQFTNTSGVASAIDNTHITYKSTGEAKLDENGMVFFEGTDGIKLVDDSGSEVRIDANGDVSLTNGTVSILLSGGQVSISGNLNVQGTETTVDTQSLLVSDNIIEVNKDQVGTPLAGLQSGLRINRGDLDDYYVLFDEDTQSFMIGTMTSLQKVATREDTPTNTAIPFWNDTLKQFQTSASLVWNGSKIISDVETVDGFHANDNDISDNDITLATKNKVKSYSDAIQSNLTNHENNIGNPHGVTKAQVGLGNTPNWVGSTNTSLGLSNSTIPSQAAVKTYVDNKVGSIDFAHFAQTDNPHQVTKAQVGLPDIPDWNSSIDGNLGTSDTTLVSQKAVKTYVDTSIAGIDFAHFTQTNNPHEVTKAQVGLPNIPNWSGITTWGTPTDTQIPSALLVKSSLDSKSDNGHTHDGRYYTEGEMDNFLDFKANSSDVYTQSQIDTFLSSKSNISHSHGWIEITGKPSSFTPSAHSHPWGEVTGKPDQATRWPAWSEVTSKPTEFNPSSHSHSWGEVTGKPAEATRWPTWNEVTSKPTEFNPSSHTHTWNEVTSKPTEFNPSSHTHAWGEVTGKPAQATRWPTWSEVTDKPTTFAPSSHNHDSRYYTETESDNRYVLQTSITVSTSNPTGGSSGDIWFKV